MFPFATHLTDGGSGIVTQRIWSCNKLVSQAWSTKAFTSAAKNGDKRTDLNIQHVGVTAFKLNSSLGHPLVGVWQQFICYLVLNIPWHALYIFWSRHWKLANHFLQRCNADRQVSFKFERFTLNKAHRNKALRLFLHHCLKGWGFSRQMTQQSMMLLWFPTYLIVAFVYLVISRNLWVYQGPMTCHI